VLVGPAGWSYADWEGRVYPRPRPPGFHPLAYLSRFVDCVELNSSFYALPRTDHAARWVDLLAERPDFPFLAKLHQDFTHGPWRRERADQAEAFRRGLAPLVEARRLAAHLAQFPIHFRQTADGRDRLGRLRDLFPEVPLVVELRHRSWFDDRGLALVERLGLSLAWIDLPPARDHPPAGHPCPGPIAYARLHGRNAAAWFDPQAGRDAKYDYLYGSEELERIAERVREMAAGGRRTFLVTNNHYGGKAVANALQLKSLLGTGEVTAPEILLETFPELRPIARSEGQQLLF
jgi:uncharacterized protein YecE (DUF72 family)